MNTRFIKLFLFFSVIALGLFIAADSAYAQAASSSSGINISIPFENEGLSTPLKLLLFVTLLTFLPAMIISATSFTRIIIVFSFLRQAMGVQSSPPNQVLIGLSLFLTFSIMSPVFQNMYDEGLKPYFDGKIVEEDAWRETMQPLRQFMYAQTRTSDINLMLEVSKSGEINSFEDLPNSVLIPAFILSELKTAFQIGFMLYIPFVVLDMMVGMILLAMGMMVLPPVVISLPFKIMLFVLVDGWDLVVSSMVKSFR